MYSEEAQIAHVQDLETLILNKGQVDGIEIGQRFQVYNFGAEIEDPVTGEKLGKLEIVKGTGKVVHIQDRICTLKSDMKTAPLKTIRKPSTGSLARLMAFPQISEIEEILPAQTVAFASPERGDTTRPI